MLSIVEQAILSKIKYAEALTSSCPPNQINIMGSNEVLFSYEVAENNRLMYRS